ncbi:hypothetical protein Tco_1455665 [Tanacetum coccineum]
MKDSEMIQGKRERNRSLSLKAKKESGDENSSTSDSEDEDYAMETSRNFSKDKEDLIEYARYNLTTNLPYGMFLTRLYRHVMKHYPHLDNGIYNIVNRVMRPLVLKQTRKPRSDRGKVHHSVSSTSSHHNHGSSSHHGDDDEDYGASRASTPSPTT